jgi:hypothetical protein
LEPNLKDHFVRDRNLCRGAEPNQHTRKSEDDARLAIETLGVRIHRLSLGGNLCKHDRQGMKRIVVIRHPVDDTSRNTAALNMRSPP